MSSRPDDSGRPKRRRIASDDDEDDNDDNDDNGGGGIDDSHDSVDDEDNNNDTEERGVAPVPALDGVGGNTGDSNETRRARLSRLASDNRRRRQRRHDEQQEERRRRSRLQQRELAEEVADLRGVSGDDGNNIHGDGEDWHGSGERRRYDGGYDDDDRDDHDDMGGTAYDDETSPLWHESGPLDDDNVDDEDAEGEDLAESAARDYRRIDALDTYGTEGMDDGEYDAMTAEERAAAEAVLLERDEKERGRYDSGGGRGLFGVGRTAGFYDALGRIEEGEEDGAREARRSRFGGAGAAGIKDVGDESDQDEQDDESRELDDDELMEREEEINLEAFDVPLREWIAQDRTRREVARKFRNFLSSFTEDGEGDGDGDDDDDYGNNSGNGNGDGMNNRRKARRRRRRRSEPLYQQRIRHMCASNRSSLDVSYMHLMTSEPILAIWIADAPRDMLDVLDEALTRHTLKLFPSYGAIIDGDVKVRISDVPILDSLRDLRRSHLDALVRVEGVVTRRSGIFPQLKLAYYDCLRCNYILGPYRAESSAACGIGTGGGGGGGGAASSTASAAAAGPTPSSCPSCDGDGPFRLNARKTLYRNTQRLQLQETPGSVPPGRVPRSKEIILTDDLIDAARPGEQVDITGVYCHGYDGSLTLRSGFPVFRTHVYANHVRRKEDDASASNLSELDIELILKLGRDPHIGERIVQSIAPSIYGHVEVKVALAMALFGGVPKNVNGRHRIRGDVNVLLLGDPGTAKSQFLKYAERTAPRAVYSTGKGASAVGLTASVHKDHITREWTLEGGALVLADRGLCLIDEFDKMNERDRTSIHEAMEQQSISVSKAGIVTSLQARCAVIAAANPIGGRYDSSCTLAENVELTDPILQRFDCLCVLQDTIDPVADERLARFVTASHMRSVPTNEVARGGVDGGVVGGADGPNVTDPAIIPQSLLRKYIQYARSNIRPVLRGQAFDQEKIASLYVALRRESAKSGGVPIAVRHVESIMRMAEAHAKMHLREYVRDDDVDAAVGAMLHSFIGAQKFAVRRALRRSFSKYMSSGEDRAHLLLHILQDMMRNEAVYQTVKMRQRGGGQRTMDDDAAAAVDESNMTLEVLLEEFEGRARDRRIYDVMEFCRGEAFMEAGYRLDENRGVIVRSGSTGR